MFGYIAPRFDQLTEPQRERYRGYYCGLCRLMGERSGYGGRLTLSHDMTFLAMLLSSLYEPEQAEKDLRCPVHPFRRRKMFFSSVSEYAADMNLLLMYYKCEDRAMDDRSPAGRIGMKALEKPLAEIGRDRPLQAEAVRTALDDLWREEKKPSPDPDRLCNLSGDMLAAVFVPDPDDAWSAHLRAVGAGLGRFVYWMDAWDDLSEDLKHGRYNPLREFRNRDDYESFTGEILEMLIGEAVSHFEILPLEKDLDLLRNVLYSGVWQRYYAPRHRKDKEKADG